VIGGHGAYGRVVEVHLRLRAIPEADVTRTWTGSLEQVERVTTRLGAAGTMAASLEAFSRDGRWCLAARSLGTRAGADEEMALITSAVGDELQPAGVGASPWSEWRDRVGAWESAARIGADPARWSEAVRLAAAHGAGDHSATVPLGLVRARFGPDDARNITALRSAAAARGWPVTLEQAGDALQREIGIWGAMNPGALALARSLRATLGPEGTHEVPLWV
jgi:hypothetical protein